MPQQHTRHLRPAATAWLISAALGAAVAAADPVTHAATAPAEGEVRRGMSMADPPEARFGRWFAELARHVEPSGRGDLSRLNVYLRLHRREIVQDPRLFAFNVTALHVDGQIRLVGAAEYGEQLDALKALLAAFDLGAPVEDLVAPMPTPALAGVHFGKATGTRVMLRLTPDPRSEVVTEALDGEPLILLDRSADGDTLLVHTTSEGYLGWIPLTSVKPIDADAFTAALNDRPADHAAAIDRALDWALARRGVKYVWGGRGDEGLDCSGLVQQAFAEGAGLRLPRDAGQQALVGRMVAVRHHRDALRRGDLLFFLGRRGFVAHVAIYLGDGRFVEAEDGGVKVTSFRKDDPDYDAQRDARFCFAKRVLD